MYHPHFDEMTQMALGMNGLFVIHPRSPQRRPDRDFAIMLSEWRIEPGTSRPNPNEMTDFNLFTMNSKAFPATEPLVVKLGERVKIRIANLSPMDHHPIHLHGFQFRVTETDGGQIPESAQQRETTVLVQVGSTRSFEFIADLPGDWPMHCHMTHHVMNQMGHNIPNMVGVNAEGLDETVQSMLPDYMTMGQTGMGDMAESYPRLIAATLIALVLIVLLLYASSRSWFRVLVVLSAIPFSLIGAFWFRWMLDYNPSLAVMMGFIALAGLDAETGQVMLLYLDTSFNHRVKDGRMRTPADLFDAFHEGAVKRIRPKTMTVAAAFVGLVPLLWTEGAGADVMRRLAAPMIGALAISFLMELLMFPVVFFLSKRWQLQRALSTSGRSTEQSQGLVRVALRD
jgi:hypothetical protein